MKELDYNELTGEIADHLEKSINIVLATCADGIVTGRTMNHINDGLNVIFSTSAGSEKRLRYAPIKMLRWYAARCRYRRWPEFAVPLRGMKLIPKNTIEISMACQRISVGPRSGR